MGIFPNTITTRESLVWNSSVQFAAEAVTFYAVDDILIHRVREEDLVELKFRLYDGTDIGPIRYSSASTVAMVKERIVAEWPKDKKIVPKVANDVKLICAGKILENNKTVGQCRIPFGELPGGVITMHVVVQTSLAKTKTEKKLDDSPRKSVCSCSIL
ncbi:hypothetical protein NE237_005710 [Protea cynaroides]|uniref:Ubiquitin-like domain-containing protein n=1 Tax=Protea cynaroides TaxID=273540 RepID=A0A9Q0KL65_9MAGN|nr:hypothetical protein NE237_005710 [Protea cynaroides]